jgi:hypothetical protein
MLCNTYFILVLVITHKITKNNLFSFVHAGRFIIFSVITNIYNKKTKGLTAMELFTATGKLKNSYLTTREVRCVHHGWHGTHRYDIQVLATHASTWVHGYSSLTYLLNGPMHRCKLIIHVLVQRWVPCSRNVVSWYETMNRWILLISIDY